MARLDLTVPPHTQEFTKGDQRTNWQNLTQMLREIYAFIGAPKVQNYTVAGLPNPASSSPGALVMVTDEAGGAVLAFSDGTNWRRVTDRAVVS